MNRLILFVSLLLGVTSSFSQSSDLLPVKVDYKWGYINRDGKVLITPKYDNVEDFRNLPYAAVGIENKRGLIDTIGNVILPIIYNKIETIDRFVIKTAQDSLWGIKKITGEELTPEKYTSIEKFNNRFFTKENLYRLETVEVDSNSFSDNSIINSRSVKREHPYFSGDSSIEKSGKRFYLIGYLDEWGIADESGKVIVPVAYKKITVQDGIFILEKDKKFGFINLEGKELAPCIYKSYKILTRDIILLQDSLYYWSGHDFSGNILFASKYTDVVPQSKNSYLFLKTGNHKDLYSCALRKIISDTTYHEYLIEGHGKYIFTVLGRKMGVITHEGAVVSKPLFWNIAYDEEGVFKINKEGKWGLMNLKGEIILTPAWNYIGVFRDHVARTINKDRWGLINIKGKIIHPCNADYIVMRTREADAMLGEEKTTYTFDSQGNVIDKVHFNKIKTLRIDSRDVIKIDTVSRFNFNTNSPSRTGAFGGEATDEYGWFSKNGKWGLKATDTSGKLYIPSFLDEIQVYPEYDLTLVSIQNKDFGTMYGLVDHKLRKFIIRPGCEQIFIDDFKDGDYARIIQTGRRYALLSRNGRIINSMTVKDGEKVKSLLIGYIGEFHEDLALINVGGKVNMHPNRNDDLIFRSGRNLGSCNGGTYGYINREGEWVVQPQYQMGGNFYLGRAIVRDQKLYGVIDNKGKYVIPNKYGMITYMPNTNDSLFLLEKFQTKSGIINNEGKIIIEPQFDDIGEYSQGYAKAKLHGYWGFINTSGDTLTPFKFEETRNFREGLAAVKLKSKWGYINLQGQIVISPEYSFAGDFHEGFAMVKIKGKVGYINQSGKIIIEAKYLKGTDFCGELAAVKRKRKFGIINKEGKWIVKPSYKKVDFLPNGYAIVKNKKYGMISNHGKHILKCKYKKVNPFHESLALVTTKKGESGYIDSTGKFIIPIQYKNASNFSEGFAKVLIGTKYGYINKQGAIVINPVYRMCNDFKEGKAFASIGAESGFIDPTGKIILHLKSNTPLSFSDGFTILHRDKNVLFINNEGKAQFKKEFENASPFIYGIAIINQQGYGIINKNGTFIISPRYKKIENFIGNYSEVINTSFKGIADRNGKIVIPANYELITFNHYLQVFKVEKGDYIGYLDIFGNWIWKSTK